MRLRAETPDRMHSRMTVNAIARDLQVHPATVRKLLKSGVIPSLPLGRGWLVTKQVYQKWRAEAHRMPMAS